MPRQRASIRVSGSELRLQRFQATVAIGGTAVPFTPASLTGLALWFDASDATTLYTDAGTTLVSADGDAIYQWNDKSGNSNTLTQTTLANRPLYKTGILNGHSIARFDSTDIISREVNLSPADVSQPDTVFVVGNSTQASGGEFFDAASGRQYLSKTGGNWKIDAGTSASDGAADNNTHAFAMIFNGASSSLWVDGGSGTTGMNTNTGGLIGFRVGSFASGAGEVLGDIAEIVVYNGALSLTSINLMGHYLAGKYGLTWTTAT